jgi:hypothetical protein
MRTRRREVLLPGGRGGRPRRQEKFNRRGEIDETNTVAAGGLAGGVRIGKN